MSMPWFHASRLPAVGDVVVLDRDEAKHAIGVRRLGSGDGVTIFDGTGGTAQAALTGERDRDGGVLARVGAVSRVERSGVDVVAGIAPPKGDRFGPGVRVPTLIVSPLARKGFVDHTVYDTTSILRTLEVRFGLKPLTARDASVADLRNAFVGK